jgi:hypothetical protein
MTPIHLAGEMAVWSEDKWAAFEGELQSQLRAERRRLERLAAKRRSARQQATVLHTVAWTLLSAAILVALFH